MLHKIPNFDGDKLSCKFLNKRPCSSEFSDERPVIVKCGKYKQTISNATSNISLQCNAVYQYCQRPMSNSFLNYFKPTFWLNHRQEVTNAIAVGSQDRSGQNRTMKPGYRKHKPGVAIGTHSLT